MHPPSIFNNILGPVMRGPSSSHTAAAVRIGRLGRRLLSEEPVYARFTFDPRGSVATTYRGQGSAMGLAAGLLGMDIADKDLLKAEELCSRKGLKIEYRIEKFSDAHPNIYNTYLKGASGKEVSFMAISTGGGNVRLTRLNNEPVDDDLDYINPLMPVRLKRDPVLPFKNINELVKLLEQKGGALSDYAVRYETAIGDVSEEDALILARSYMFIMREAINDGLAGTSYEDRLLPRQSHLFSQAPEKGQLIPASLANTIIRSVTAVMEVKSAMGLIVAAPTAGSCGTLPGVLLPSAEAACRTENEIMKALLAAGMVGIFIANECGFAAEEGGCQYECGSASGMAAAALVELMGGDGQMSLNAASMALQNTLGMICDPVADRVEVPCLGKNIMAALNALAAANMTIAGYDHVIPLDEVIKAMKEVGDDMNLKYRCTCKGGLSTTPTARRIHKDLSSSDKEVE
ncbi:MAG: L-serine ammonia-lyase, iron-sulfur-dependent, subunit alpha [Bacteroidales bacterium]|nr:L-serine ammonia-lyase, iron-sulfur-dependent, subunit alpha [Bacteroidales bacterium]